MGRIEIALGGEPVFELVPGGEAALCCSQIRTHRDALLPDRLLCTGRRG